MYFPAEWCYNEYQARVDLWRWMVIKKNGELIQSKHLYFNTEIALLDVRCKYQNFQINYHPEKIIALDASALLINCFSYLYWEKVMSLARENCVGE